MATAAELDSLVAELNLTIALVPGEQQRSFTTFQELKKFISDEVSFWNEVGVAEVSKVFSGVIDNLNQASGAGAGNARSYIATAVRMAQNHSDTALIYSGTSRANFLKGLRNPVAARAAFFYITNRGFTDEYNRPILSGAASFNGLVAAMMSIHPEFISADLPAELEAVRRQRAALESECDQTRTRSRADIKEIGDFIETQLAQFDALLEQYKQLLEDEQQTFAKQNQQQLDSFQSTQNALTQKIQQMEALFSEKLRLQEPARYWGELEKMYKFQGICWIGAAVLATVLGAWWVIHFVYKPPEIWNTTSFTLSGIKGAILIGAGISAVVYLLNTFVKIATSSYHLARDARERQQLTHIYLALIQDNAITPDDRKIILTSLFSRSDTGLLKGDSGPTLPTPINAVIDTLKPK